MNRLKEIRESKGMTQTQLGEVIGAKKSAVSLWESGKRQIDNNTLKSLADFFGVSVDYILGRDQEELAQLSLDNDVEVRFLSRGGLSPERRKKVEALLASLMDLDDEALDQAEQVIDIYRKR
jgi:transcriptional regulator with XRE-family HTH domain